MSHPYCMWCLLSFSNTLIGCIWNISMEIIGWKNLRCNTCVQKNPKNQTNPQTKQTPTKSQNKQQNSECLFYKTLSVLTRLNTWQYQKHTRTWRSWLLFLLLKLVKAPTFSLGKIKWVRYPENALVISWYDDIYIYREICQWVLHLAQN